jgi:hypothetical protein
MKKSPPPLSVSPLGTGVKTEELPNSLFEAFGAVWFLFFRLGTGDMDEGNVII